MRTPSQKYPGVYSYAVRGGRKWGAVADHGMVGGKRRRPRQEGFLKEKEARDWQVSELAAGPTTPAVASDLTLGHWVERWLLLRGAELTWGTISSYRAALGRFGVLADVRLVDLGVADVEVALAELRGAYSVATVRHARTVLVACLEAAVQMGVIVRNVAKPTRVPVASRGVKEYLTAEAVRLILDQCRGDAVWGLPIWVLAETWMRIGEVQALTWADLRLSERVIRVWRTTRRTADGEVVGDSAKTKRSARVIAISDGLATALTMARDRSQFSGEWHEGQLIFRNTFGGLLNRTQLRLALAGYCEAAGVAVISPHGLRHAGASMAIRAGVDPKVVSERLGHTGVAFTFERYVHPNTQDHEDAAVVVAGLLGVSA